ncbi:hypothetical protein [Acetobacterium woodii]|uniref:Uncharacterized protein n=1 Tax=Acetobacterium woodii (strain ATCC 29683 / DSM 1030 / JCM 2381 / KCTC 1655 / WB1) TaxID=931626 RepID=H6LDF6_ACEWD|nr:hypothetical protein [Acetobacterium woodii]AFA47928.1 hypothetical protein Awo_c11440 [Acetobacterium woodii DSM 1030]
MIKKEIKNEGIYFGLPKSNKDIIIDKFPKRKNRGKNLIVLGEVGETKKRTACFIEEAINNGENLLFIDPKSEYEKVKDIDFNIRIFEEGGDLNERKDC